jgi:hypothetical protein
MAAAGSMSYGANGFASGASSLQHTVTALNRWSVAKKQLPRKQTGSFILYLEI